MIPAIVLPRVRVPGWSGDQTTKADQRTFEPSHLLDALEREYPGEACFVQYAVDAYTALPRLNKPSLAYYIGREEPEQPALHFVLVDIDYPNHAVPPDGWSDSVLAKVPAPLSEHVGWYRTPHGMRLVFLPAAPVLLPYASAYLEHLHDLLSKAGIGCDAATKDWTRLFKAPRALGRDLPRDFSKLSPLPASAMPGVGLLTEESPRTMASFPNVTQPKSRDVYQNAPKKKEYAVVADKRLREALADGRLTAPVGERHATVLHAACEIIKGDAAPDPRRAFKLLVPSLETLNEFAEREMDLDELWRICEWAAARVVGEGIDQERERKEALDVLAETIGTTPEEARRRLILDTGAAFYVWNERRLCYTPYTAERQLLPALVRDCPSCAGLLAYETRNVVLAKLSSPVQGVTYSFAAEQVEYDAVRGTLTIPTGRPDPRLTPEYNADVHRWLESIVPEGANRDRFFDWLASFPKVEQPICALYIHGPRSIGKGLLATGLARLYNEPQPARYEEVSGKWSEGLLRCPLVWADESIPKDPHAPDDSGKLRRLIGNGAHRVAKKRHDSINLRGYLRVLVTANNADVLRIHEDMSPEDVEAVRLRLGYVRVEDTAQKTLETMAREKGCATIKEMTQPWVDDGLIAKHVLYVAENRRVIPGQRFLVEGWESELTEDLAASHGASPAVVETITLALLNQRRGRSVMVEKARGTGKYSVLVSGTGLLEQWDFLRGFKDGRRPPAGSSITSALKSMSGDQGKRKRVPNSEKYGRFWVIEADLLRRLAVKRGFAAHEDFDAALVSDGSRSLSARAGASGLLTPKKPEKTP